MTTAQPPPPSSADACVGYQAAINLVGIEGQQTWARFNVMIVAHTILLAGIAVLYSAASSAHLDRLAWIAMGPILAGFLLCWIWFRMTERGFDVQRYYVQCADTLERHLPGVRIVQDYAARVQPSNLQRRLAQYIVCIFAALYLVVLVFTPAATLSGFFISS